MNYHRRRVLLHMTTAVTIFSLLLNLVLPAIDFTAQAQDATEEAPAPTEEAVQVPEETTAEPPVPTSEATAEPTANPTAESTTEAPTPLPTETPTTPAPTQTPAITVFSDNLQDGTPDGWLLTNGWQIGVEGENLFLTASTPNETAMIADLLTGDFSFAAQIRLDAGNVVNVHFRSGTEGYKLALDAMGNATLFRNADLAAVGSAVPLPTDGSFTALWHAVKIDAIGGQIVVTVDGVQQIIYVDAVPLPAGAIFFSTEPTNTGKVSIDQLLVTQPDLMVPIPTVTTPEIIETVVPEATAETTPEATTEVTPEATTEATPEALPNPGTLVLSADFEAEVIGWTASEGTSVVLESETNHALLMAASSSLFPTEPLLLADFTLDARLNIMSDAGNGSSTGISIPFRTSSNEETGVVSGYVVSIEAGQTALYRNGAEGLQLLASSPTAHALNTWHTISLNTVGGHITLSMNGVVELDYTDAEPLLNGQIALLANAGSSVMVDDIAVTDFSLMIPIEPTAIPFVLTDAERAKMPENLVTALELALGGDTAGALTAAKETFIPLDEEGRVLIVVWAQQDGTGAALAPMVEAVGGVIDGVNPYSVEARLPITSLIALVNLSEIHSIALSSIGVSTSSTVNAPGTGSAVSEGYDVIGANDWNNLGITGVGQRIAVIDTGYVGLSTSAAGEKSCLQQSPATVGTGNHGTRVIQVICDIAPGSDVYAYTASTAATMLTALNTARNTANANIILIAMDLGVNASPGDGTDGDATAYNAGLATQPTIYDAIHKAQDEGRLVIVSAGNNFGKYASFNYGAGTTTITINAAAGDKVNLSWNDWDSAPNSGGAREDLTIGNFAQATDPTYNGRVPNSPPSTQFTLASACAPCTFDITGKTGNAANMYVQVQVTGSGDLAVSGSATGVNTTSSIGRPGDSLEALTVGAVCASTEFVIGGHFSLLTDSSRGPIFTAGGNTPGSATPTNRDSYKPNLVGPSHVSTSFDLDIPNGITGIEDPCNLPGSTAGFNGTSAAAAHVAGAAALVRSNTNANIGIAPAGATAQDVRQNVVDYLQSHTVELYLGSNVRANGFDMLYGAGLTTLGSPAPLAAIGVDHNTLSNVACVGGTAVYVSAFSLSGDERTIDGTLGSRANPYIHMAEALAEAPANACVIVMPGEYVGGVFLDDTTLPNNGVKLQSYQFNFPAAANSTIWANNGIIPGASIAVGSSSSEPNRSFTLSGFKFLRANPLVQRLDTASGLLYPPSGFLPASAIVISNSSGTVTLDKNEYSLHPDDANEQTITANHASPVVVEGSTNVVIENSTFYNNDSDVAGVKIQNSGTGTTIAVNVRYNTFRDSLSTINTGFNPSLILVSDSTANIVSNRFTGNRTTSIITVRNLSDPTTAPFFTGAKEVNILGNAIFSNANNGPIVKLDVARRVRFSNNTVANHGSMAGSNIIERGNANNTGFEGALEMNNNLLYANAGALTLFTDLAGNALCYNFSGTAGEGVKNNWSEGSGGTGGDCVDSINGFNNRINDNSVPMGTLDAEGSVFIGSAIAPDDPYQLRGDAIYGLDVGNNALVPGFFTAVGSLDALHKKRVDPSIIDLGAYEYIAVAALPITVNLNEDDPPLGILMNDYVVGGFGPYTFLVLSAPPNYSADTSNFCSGQPLKQEFIQATKQTFFTYCLPDDFYTVGAPAGSSANFTFQIRDASGGLSDPTPATININPVDDTALTTPITYNVVVEGHEGPGTRNVTFRLRPYARFNNYRIVRPNDESDYPYDYTFGAQTGTPGQNNGMFTNLAAAVNGADAAGLATLTLNPNEVGFVEFSYTAVDANGNDSVNNIVKLTVVASLPDTGLHDNTSFAFLYRGATEADQGFWAPVYSEININNTLHTTVALNDTADFLFNGAAFALYMQASAAGGNWELQIDNGGTLVQLPWNGAQVISQSGITCRTSALTGKATATLPNLKYYISNRGTVPYVVSCSGLIEGEPNTIRIINREARSLSIDAVGIYNDDLPLLPGPHEVTETQLVPLFLQGWTQITDVRASGQKAVAFTGTTTGNLPGVVRFKFRGTGFTLGTTLEQNTTLKQGAKYRVCVAKTTAPDQTICQNFDNALGATTAPIYNVYRPFFGFDPTLEYQVTIEVTSLPVKARMVIDSIIVFDQEPTDILPFGTTEDNQLGPIVFSNALPDTWTLDTNNARTSNRSLTSIIATVPKAGPFISFRIPASADVINWQRFATTADSPNVLVCVDRAQFETLTNVCKEYNLRLAGTNPLTIKESDFIGGWGAGFGSTVAHTVEIFSLTNFPFNVDSIQVLNSNAPLVAGNYEQTVPNLKFFNDDPPTYSFTGSSFITVANTLASGGNYARTVEQNEGIFFRFTGTGFSTLFALDRYASNVKYCWLEDVGATATVDTVLASPTCQTISNAGTAILYKIARTFVGLENSTYAVVVQNLGVDYNPVTKLGNNMQIDGIRIYGEDWSTLTQLAPGTRHETSFVNRVVDNKFLYYGPTWKSVVGTAARLYSGSNYDNIASFGAGVVFRTNGGNVVRIIRDIRAGYSPLMVCTAPTDDFTPYTCNIVRNDGGTANQQIFNIPLSGTGAHVVSITTLTGGIFNLDAIEVTNNTPALTAGIYPETDPRLSYSPINALTTGWRNLYVTSFVDRGAMQSTGADQASVTFTFQGTGFSLFTLFELTAGALNVTLDGTGANDYSHTTKPELVFNNNRATVLYGSTHSVTGLPFDTYTVTITESATDAKNKITVDGLQIYGDLPTAMAPGLYDNAAVDAANVPYLTFGPTTAWTARTTAGYLNLTNHLSNRHGANVTFEVDDAGYITLFHNLTTSTLLRVCAKTLALNGSASWTCGTTTTAKNRVNTTISLNNGAADIPLNAGGVGDYLISVTNLTHATNFIVDAVQIVGATNLTEGIYQESHPLLSFTNSVGAAPNGGVWAAAPAKVAGTTDGFARSTVANATGQFNQTLNFSFTGTGFSIVLLEGSTTSGSYEICVTGQIACAPLTRANAATARSVALTYVGFANGTYNVTLRNKDNTKPLIVDRVDILGALTAGEQIANTVTGSVENTDPRITFFPYYTFPVTANVAASGGSQSIGSMIGSVAYFELNGFTGTAFEYVRQTLTSYGSVDVCSAALGTNSHNCAVIETVANNVAPLTYQRAEAVAVAAGTRWVILRNKDGKPMPLDFIRPTVSGQPQTAGSFEETHPAIQYFTETSGTGAGPFVLGGNGNFVDTPLPAASGGAVKLLSADAGSAGNGLYEGALFQFTGRGFGVKFTLDAKADEVKICWLAGLTTNVANVINTGTCTTLDNQSAAARYQATRLVYGLNGGNYTAVVQMLPDNTLPAVHAPAALPITMQLDAVQVFDENWTGLTPLAVGVKTETSYVNRVVDDRFFYFGNGWKTVVGTAAKLYSGTNYDNIANVIGAGISFRVADASAIVLYRDTRAGYAPMQVCASPEGTLTQRFCTTVANNGGTGVSQPARVFLSSTPTVGDYIVTISTLDLGIVNIDAIQSVDTTLALLPGLYQNNYPALTYAGGNWTELFGAGYSGGTFQQSTDIGATLTFTIDDASGFEVAIPMDRFGGEVEICYDDDGTPADGDCYTYQHERAAASLLVTRTVTGLTVGTQYTVQIKNVENGFTSLVVAPNTPRPAAYNPARLRIDYVQVFGEALPPVVNNPGVYGEGANNGTTNYLQLLPTNRWNTFAGTAAKGFSDLSYTTVVDNAKRLSALYAGPTATLRVNVPAGGATVILFTGPAVTNNTDQLLVCADVVDSDAGKCTVITNLRLVNQVVLNSALLTELGNAGNVTLTFRALTPGAFKIDGFQVIHGTTLTPGIYDNYLIANGGLLNTNGTTWLAALKTANTYGGTISPASSTAAPGDDPTLQFNIDGTGFGIVTLADTTGVDLRICYVATADFDGNFDAAGTETCETVTTDTNTTPADWNTKNDGRNKPTVGYQYTFGYYGLAADEYTVQVRMIDTVLVATDRLKIDAVIVFSDVTNGGAATPLSPGQIYDNTQTSGISYEPGTFWSVTKTVYGPPRGAWQLSDTRATAAGSLLQVYAEGNALVLYQSAGPTGSRRVRVCLSTIDGLDCTEFSQFVSRATYFTPVVFYGLGTTSVHRIYIENRDHGRPMSIDAIRMLE